MRHIYILTILCMLTACGGKQVAEKHVEGEVDDSTATSLIADSLAATIVSHPLTTVEDTLEFKPQAEVALYSKVFEAKTECEYWIVNLALEKDGDLTVREPFQPDGVDSILYEYTPLYKFHITITDKRKSKDNVRNIYITREMLNNIDGLNLDILERFDVTNCMALLYNDNILCFRCRMCESGTDWDIFCGCIIGPDYVKIYDYPYPEEYLSEL